MSGNLVIRPLSAKLTHDTETFGKMDPYCKVSMGTQYKQTAVCQDGGKFPGWKDELSFRHTNEDIIQIEVWDKDSASKNDLIGSGSIAFSTIKQKGNRMNEWIHLTYKGKSAGEVLMDIQYYADGGNKTTTTTTTTAPTMMPTGYGQQPYGYAPQPGFVQPTYVQPTYVQPQPTYQQPTYVQPQPTYQQPTYVQPQPTYQQPTYVQPQPFQQQAYPQQQSYPQQAYPQQGGYPQQQAYPQQGGYPQQGYPQQGGYPQYPPHHH